MNPGRSVTHCLWDPNPPTPSIHAERDHRVEALASPGTEAQPDLGSCCPVAPAYNRNHPAVRKQLLGGGRGLLGRGGRHGTRQNVCHVTRLATRRGRHTQQLVGTLFIPDKRRSRQVPKAQQLHSTCSPGRGPSASRKWRKGDERLGTSLMVPAAWAEGRSETHSHQHLDNGFHPG